MFCGVAAIRSIKTDYRGVTFMSTLEADWAHTLDNLRIVWAYEPEGVKLADGQNYRPDILLPHLRTWLEVKGPHDQRIDKPARLAEACLHSPGCGTGRPETVFTRPATIAPASCACGHGDDFPWMNVIIGRPAVAGKVTFEPPHGIRQQLAIARCPLCRQHSFIDLAGAPVCRRCRRDLTGADAYTSGQLPFRKLEPPRGGRRRRTATAAR